MAFSLDLENLGASTQHLLHTVSDISQEQWRAPSLLPGWTRGHVVAHLVLNAEGFAGAVEGIIHRSPTPVYASQESRDGDIEDLAAQARSLVSERLEQSSARLATALSSLDGEQVAEEVERIPDGPRWAVSDIPRSRRREVEVHHADLGLAYSPSRWPTDFDVELLEALAADRSGQGPFTLVATDLGRDIAVGSSGGPEVRGTAAALGWWLVGRGAGEGLEVSSGELPDLGRWR